MRDDPEFRKHAGKLKRLLGKVDRLINEAETALDGLTALGPSAASLAKLNRIRTSLVESLRNYLNQDALFVDHIREQSRRIEEGNRRTAVSEKRSRPKRDEARIQKVSEELSRDLRLQRVDGAIKELLDFLSDEEFFADNASTGRRRRLRTLQNAIDKAL